MPKKPWHIYIARGSRGELKVGITNEPETLVRPLYIEPCRDRTAALKRLDHIRTLNRTQKIKLVKSAGEQNTSNELPDKLYKVINERFICNHCGQEVLPTEHDGPRNHCPFCLYSKHVDINPGDRKNPCGGMLKPVEVEISGRKGYIIVYKCEKCGERTRSKAALKSTVQPDDFDKIVGLSQHFQPFNPPKRRRE